MAFAVARSAPAFPAPAFPAPASPAPAFPALWFVRESAPTYGAASAHAEPPDDDALTALGEEIMTLSGHIASVTHRLLVLIAEFDRRQGWRLHGFANCADWLAYSTRINRVTAREQVRVARALVGLPETSAAMARGQVSYSQVRAMTRVATEEDEREWLAHAHTTSAAGLERLTRSSRRLDREDEAALAARRHASRFLSVYPDDEGGYVVRGRLDPEIGATLMRAIEAASDALYQGSVPDVTPDQRRADALALLVERALTDGFASGDERGGASAEARCGSCEAADASAEARCEPSTADRQAPDASAEAGCAARAEDCGGADASAEAGRAARDAGPLIPNRSERYMVILHVDEATLDPTSDPGRSDLEDGTRVSAEAARRIACDANIVRVVHGGDGEARVEARTRSIPLRLRRALEIRDRGCRFPGCGCRFTDAHHIRHWADGGATRLDNLILLCRTHHRLLHEGGFRLEPGAPGGGRPVFKTPKGMTIPEVPPVVKVDGRSVANTRRNGAPPRWETDVPLALYLRALDALG